MSKKPYQGNRIFPLARHLIELLIASPKRGAWKEGPLDRVRKSCHRGNCLFLHESSRLKAPIGQVE